MMERTADYRVPWRRLLTAAAVFVVVWFAARTLRANWSAFRAAAATVEPRWGLVALSATVVLLTYAVLVQSWRTLVTAWGGRLGYGDAVRIWTVSNLARYVPGTLWSVGVMSVLAQRAGVRPAAAAGAAVLGTVLNLAAGFVVLTATGGDYVARLAPGVPYPRLVTAAIGVAGAIVLPLILYPLTTVAARVLGREPPARLPTPVLVGVLLANLAAWLGYGVAFGCLARALHPGAGPGVGSDWVGYVAVYAGSYLAGYLALLLPGGIGVREAAMVVSLTHLRLATGGEATLLAIASRLLLTVLELAPGLTFVAAGALRRGAPPLPSRPDTTP